jgi:hypothetical protein
MSDFLVLFDEKEGTSNLMKLLDQFQGVSVVHQTNDRGWEPFDWHLHQTLYLSTLFKCLRLVYSRKKGAESRLNEIYERSSERPLINYDKSGDIGFKMRFHAPVEPDGLARFFGRLGVRGFDAVKIMHNRYERGVLTELRRHHIVVLFAVRQEWSCLRFGRICFAGPCRSTTVTERARMGTCNLILLMPG